MITLQDPKKAQKVDQFYDKVVQANKDYLHFWKEQTLWHWDFWLSFLFTFLPWFIWFFLRKKNSQWRLLLAGCISVIFSSWLDFIGVVLHLWHYTGKFIPSIPSFVPWDFSLLPVTIMLIIQIKPQTNPWFKGLIFAVISIIGETLFKFLGFYIEENWSWVYSFPIYICLYLLCDRISKVKGFEPLT